MRKMEADIIVVGGGMGGLAAAAQGAELGASVIVLEKSGLTGGAANCGTGFFAVESRLQKEMMEDTLTRRQAFEELMEYNHWCVDARLWKRIIDISADTIDWVEKMGVEFLGVFKYSQNPHCRRVWHIVKVPGVEGMAERSGAILQARLTEYCNSLNVQFVFNTPAYDVIMDGKRVVGVKARCKDDGEEVEAYGEAIIVASGGCGANIEMKVEQYGDIIRGDGRGFIIDGLDGDGMKMCWKAGADKLPMTKHGGCFVVGLTDLYKTLGEVMHQPNLIVDLNGKRIMDEFMLTNPVYFYEIVQRQKGRQLFMIMNDEILDFYRENGLEIFQVQHGVKTIENWDQQLEAYLRGDVADTALAEMHADETRPNGFFVFDTLEEAADELGINKENLLATVERYNADAWNNDREFFKPAKYMKPIRGGKYYVARYTPFGSETMGGVRVNANIQCLDKNQDVIPGLYCVGTDSNNLYSDCYDQMLCGMTMGYAIHSGRIAAMEAVKEIEGEDE